MPNPGLYELLTHPVLYNTQECRTAFVLSEEKLWLVCGGGGGGGGSKVNALKCLHYIQDTSQNSMALKRLWEILRGSSSFVY